MKRDAMKVVAAALVRWMRSGTALLAVASCAHGAADAGAFRPLDVGSAVPAYVVRALDGDTIRVGGASAGVPTVLNVWATWCESCREEMASLDSLRRELGPKGLRVVAVSVDDSGIERVRRFAESNHLTTIVAHDPTATIERSYQVVGVPTTFIIDRTGTLLWRHTGNLTPVFAEAETAAVRALRP